MIVKDLFMIHLFGVFVIQKFRFLEYSKFSSLPCTNWRKVVSFRYLTEVHEVGFG